MRHDAGVRTPAYLGFGLALAVGLAPGCGDQNNTPPAGAISSPDGGRRGVNTGVHDGTWRDFTPPGGGIVVSMPGTPGVNPWTFVSGKIQIPEVVYMVATADRRIAYTLAVADFPPDALAETPLETRLRSGVEHHTAFEAGERASFIVKPSLAGELPALDAVSTGIKGGRSHVRTFFVGSREFGLIVTTPDGVDASAETARFFASARLP